MKGMSKRKYSKMKISGMFKKKVRKTSKISTDATRECQSDIKSVNRRDMQCLLIVNKIFDKFSIILTKRFRKFIIRL